MKWKPSQETKNQGEEENQGQHGTTMMSVHGSPVEMSRPIGVYFLSFPMMCYVTSVSPESLQDAVPCECLFSISTMLGTVENGEIEIDLVSVFIFLMMCQETKVQQNQNTDQARGRSNRIEARGIREWVQEAGHQARSVSSTSSLIV